MAEIKMEVDGKSDGTKYVAMDYPSNSHTSKIETEKEAKKRPAKVVTGSVKIQKKSFGKRLLSLFIDDNIDSVGGNLFTNVIQPAVKDLLVEVVQSGIEMLIYGESGTVGRRKKKGNFSYDMVFSSKKNKKTYARQKVDIGNLLFETRAEAIDVRDSLQDMIEEFDSATVNDLYDLIGIQGDFTDSRYGWETIANAKIRHVSEGYLLSLPKPELLD